jgi:hypothetical protein
MSLGMSESTRDQCMTLRMAPVSFVDLTVPRATEGGKSAKEGKAIEGKDKGKAEEGQDTYGEGGSGGRGGGRGEDKCRHGKQRGKCRECLGEGEAAGGEGRGREVPETQRREKRARKQRSWHKLDSSGRRGGRDESRECRGEGGAAAGRGGEGRSRSVPAEFVLFQRDGRCRHDQSDGRCRRGAGSAAAGGGGGRRRSRRAQGKAPAAGREEEGCPYLMMPADLVKRVVQACGWRAEGELGKGVVRLIGGGRRAGRFETRGQCSAASEKTTGGRSS